MHIVWARSIPDPVPFRESMQGQRPEVKNALLRMEAGANESQPSWHIVVVEHLRCWQGGGRVRVQNKQARPQIFRADLYYPWHLSENCKSRAFSCTDSDHAGSRVCQSHGGDSGGRLFQIYIVFAPPFVAPCINSSGFWICRCSEFGEVPLYTYLVL